MTPFVGANDWFVELVELVEQRDVNNEENNMILDQSELSPVETLHVAVFCDGFQVTTAMGNPPIVVESDQVQSET